MAINSDGPTAAIVQLIHAEDRIPVITGPPLVDADPKAIGRRLRHEPWKRDRTIPLADLPEGLLAVTCCQRSGSIRRRVATEMFLGKASIQMTSLLLPNPSYNQYWAPCLV